MNEFLLFVVLFGPYALGLLFMLSLIPTLIKWNKDDSAWCAYGEAYKRWDAEGKNGLMPQYDDFKRK